MKLRFTELLRKNYESAPGPVRKAFEKQMKLLAADLRHPSLRAKKYDVVNNVWQGRVNRDWRFYFTIESDPYTIIALTPHPK
jgi:mRNA-degrading endonuclease RelE of RelBE toxin-antitoxin system